MKRIWGVIAMLMVVMLLSSSATECKVSAEEIPVFDLNGTYEAYLCLQTQSFRFRNPWDDENYGLHGVEWENAGYENRYLDGLCGWENNLLAVTDAEYEDCVIDGNGTYTVKLVDFDFGNDTFLNTLFVSTSIPLTTEVSITNVSIIMDGMKKYTFDNGIIGGINTKDVKNYLEIHCINIWDNDNLGGKTGLFSYVIPVNTIEIEFTVDGFAYDHVEEAVEAVDEAVTDAESADTDSSEVSSDNTGSEDTASEALSNTETTNVSDNSSDSSTNIVPIIAIVFGAVVIVFVAVLVGKRRSK